MISVMIVVRTSVLAKYKTQGSVLNILNFIYRFYNKKGSIIEIVEIRKNKFIHKFFLFSYSKKDLILARGVNWFEADLIIV